MLGPQEQYLSRTISWVDCPLCCKDRYCEQTHGQRQQQEQQWEMARVFLRIAEFIPGFASAFEVIYHPSGEWGTFLQACLEYKFRLTTLSVMNLFHERCVHVGDEPYSAWSFMADSATDKSGIGFTSQVSLKVWIWLQVQTSVVRKEIQCHKTCLQ